MKWFLAFALVIVAAGSLVYVNRDTVIRWMFSPTPSSFNEGVAPSGGEDREAVESPEVVASGLEIPWEIVFLPGGDILVTERPGRLVRIGENQQVTAVRGVAHRGEGGLLGMALHPQFEENGWLYLYLTTETEEGLQNRVERYTLDGTTLSERFVIIEGIPGASYHDGGRIAFGPDGMLYIATGDAGVTANAQDRESLAGKILRVADDGTIPEGNPFGNAVYSLGHRNVQGLAWNEQGVLFATEHGRSGVRSGFDELNRIEPGANYGWPLIEGGESRNGMEVPLRHSGSTETWAPSGMAYVQGHLVFAGLRGESLYVAKVEDSSIAEPVTYFREDFGRLRTAVVGPDGMLYIATNNRDGRGTPRPNDDRIIRIDPASIGL